MATGRLGESGTGLREGVAGAQAGGAHEAGLEPALGEGGRHLAGPEESDAEIVAHLLHRPLEGVAALRGERPIIHGNPAANAARLAAA